MGGCMGGWMDGWVNTWVNGHLNEKNIMYQYVENYMDKMGTTCIINTKWGLHV